MSKCNDTALCQHLAGLIEVEDAKDGFHAWRQVIGGNLALKGVFYKSALRDKPLLLNACPFCKAELGEMNREKAL
jgi:hypothetical protein